MTEPKQPSRRSFLIQLFAFTIVLPWVLTAYLFINEGPTLIAWLCLAVAVSGIAQFAYFAGKFRREAAKSSSGPATETPEETLRRLRDATGESDH